MKIITVIFFLILSSVCNAQGSWGAKFVVWFEGPNQTLVPDTVWFGCDSAATDGYQAELDVVSDSFLFNQAYFVEDVLPGKYFKKNTKGFKRDEMIKFNFISKGKVRFIVWDSLEFKYESNYDSMYLLAAIIEAGIEVSFDNSHNSIVELYQAGNCSFCGYYNLDSIEVIEGGYNLRFSLFTVFGNTNTRVGLPKSYLASAFKVAIGDDFITINNTNRRVTEASLYSIDGKLMTSIVNDIGQFTIPTNNLNQGMYIIYLEDGSNNNFVTKFIKH